MPPKIAPFDFGEEPSNFADSASVACLVTTGDMPISFKWFFNNRPVKEFAGITTVKLGNRNSVLNIDSVTGKHAGQYTCEASNQAASVNYTSKLIVNGTQIEIEKQIMCICRKKKFLFQFYLCLLLTCMFSDYLTIQILFTSNNNKKYHQKSQISILVKSHRISVIQLRYNVQ